MIQLLNIYLKLDGDGDASNIPRVWLKAVFEALNAHKLLGDKKGQTVSVLGVQSSGKSTLLNSMFGLNFSVSAGRCTSGAFMKLIPANKKEQEMKKFSNDFLLVIDTEGLRSPEHLDDLTTNQRDNELATFAVGLGTVSLINLKGENISEMKDIIQIVVLAMLRMKMSSVTNSCMFIHQNVSAVNAAEKMQEGLQRLLDTLDLATKEAAQTENIHSITNFGQVLNFDTEKHVKYFPSLWKGDPPMAPVNVGYSENSAVTREAMLTELVDRKTPSLDLNNMFHKVDALWKGILTENFVFNFKNSLYIKAYDSLEKNYKEVTHNIQTNITEWRQSKEPIINKLEENTELSKLLLSLQQDIYKETSGMIELTKKEFEYFFETSEQKYMLEQWKVSKLIDYDEKVKNIKKLELKRLSDCIEEQKRKTSVYRELNTLKQSLTLKAKDHAQNSDYNNVSDTDLKKKFDHIWNSWIGEITFPISENTSDFRAETAMRILYELFNDKDLKLLTEKLNFNPISNMETKLEALENIQRVLTTMGEDDFNVDLGYLGFEDSVGNKKSLISQAEEKVELCIAAVVSFIQAFEGKAQEFEPQLLRNIFEKCNLDNYGNENKEFTKVQLKKDLKYKIIVKVFIYALKIFDVMQERYEEKNSLRNRVGSEKKGFWKIFYSLVKKEAKEMTLADMFLEVVSKRVITKIERSLQEEIVSYSVKTNSDKTQLLVKVLENLIDQGWTEFRRYLLSTKEVCEERLTNIIKEEFFLSTTKRYNQSSNNNLHELKCALQSSVEHATMQRKEGEISLQHWLDAFMDHEDTIGFSSIDFSTLINFSETIEDVKGLQSNIIKRLHDMENKLESHFESINELTVTFNDKESPYKEVFSEVWGCDARCPFCQEFCRLGESHHGKDHVCLQHRPDGFRGTKCKRTGALSITNCPLSIAKVKSFPCMGHCTRDSCPTKVCKVKHPYKKYKKYFPGWDIFPDTDPQEKSAFWFYMMSKYEEKLAKHYNLKRPEIPQVWKNITKTQARESLRNLST